MTALYILGGAIVLMIGLKTHAGYLRNKRSKLDDEEEGEVPPCSEFSGVVALSDEIVRWECGHDAPATYKHDFYGTKLSPKDEVLAERERCGECAHEWFGASVIRCVLCGHAILPGEPVACYGDMRRFKKEWKTYADEKKTAVIGCMRWDCCPSGGFFSGNWTGSGVNSPFATGSMAGDAFAGGGAIAVSTGPEGTKVERIDLNPDEPPEAA